jgi:hypothetical protein
MAQKTELPVARSTPVISEWPGLKSFPWDEMIYTPIKLMNRAIKLFFSIFCPRMGPERKTSIIGHIILSGWATCAGSNWYALRRIR